MLPKDKQMALTLNSNSTTFYCAPHPTLNLLLCNSRWKVFQPPLGLVCQQKIRLKVHFQGRVIRQKLRHLPCTWPSSVPPMSPKFNQEWSLRTGVSCSPEHSLVWSLCSPKRFIFRTQHFQSLPSNLTAEALLFLHILTLADPNLRNYDIALEPDYIYCALEDSGSKVGFPNFQYVSNSCCPSFMTSCLFREAKMTSCGDWSQFAMESHIQ